MAGTPGTGLNNPEGFISIVNPPQVPTIAVDQTVGDVAIPLSVFPFWRNDGGFRSYGGAKRISVFDAGVVEGTSSADIPAITDQPIESTGTFVVSNPDPQKLYKIVIRLRSAANDPNFRDFQCSFRLVTPLEVPLNFTAYDDADIPNIEYDGVDFTFDAAPTASEIRLRDGTGGLQLPAGTGVWNAAAKAYMLRQMQSQRDGVLWVDFFAAPGLSDSTRRQLYHYVVVAGVWTFTKIRSRDYPSFDPYSGSDLGVVQANCDIPNGAAELAFIYNGFTYGQRFESLVAIGNKGQISIDPHLAVSGGTIDISSIVDFTQLSYLHKFNITDQYVILLAITDEKILFRQVPLWPSATQLVTVDGDDFVPTTTTPIPTELLQARLLFWPFIHFPNLETTFLNVPTGAVGADPAGGKYPDLLNINIYDGINPVAVATFTDEVDLWNNLVAVRCPDQGLLFGCLDVRTLLTPTNPFFRIEADVRTAISAPGVAYTARADYPLNVNGETVRWNRSDNPVIIVFPDASFDQWGKCTIIWPATITSVNTNVIFSGDVGTHSFAAPAGPFPQTVTYDLRPDVISREASYVDVEFEATDTNAFTKTYTFRIPTTVNRAQILGATDIQVFFAGNVIIFPTGSLANVQVEGGGNQIITLIGDVGQVTIYDAQENVPYFTAQLGDGGERIFSNPLFPHVDVDFFDLGAVHCRVRCPNTFFDLRQGESAALAIASRVGGPTAGGLPSSSHNFTLPRGKIDLGTQMLTFEDDGSGFTWNFQQWQVVAAKTLRRKIFSSSIVVATPYNIADILAGIQIGEFILVTFKHRNGFQRIGAYKVSGNFETAKRLDLEGFI